MTLLRRWAWALPAFVVAAVLAGVPLGDALWTSLHRVSASAPDSASFVALSNYGLVLTSGAWWHALGWTLLLSLVIVAAELVLAVGFATALRQLPFAWPVARLVVLMPALTLAVVMAVAATVAFDSGFVATWFDLELTSGRSSIVAATLTEIWRGTGLATVIVYVGLSRVSSGQREIAAAADSTWFTRARRLWWPALWPALAFALVFRLFDTMRMVEAPALRDGPLERGRTLSSLLWHDAFASYEQGIAAASAIVLLVLSGLLGWGISRGLRRWSA